MSRLATADYLVQRIYQASPTYFKDKYVNAFFIPSIEIHCLYSAIVDLEGFLGTGVMHQIYLLKKFNT